MRWRGNRKSSNVEDRRNQRSPGGLSGLGGGSSSMLRFLPLAFRFLGFKGTAILGVAIIGYGMVSGNLGGMLGFQQGSNITQSSGGPVKQTAEEKEMVDFVSVILADTEATWSTLFRQKGRTYKEPKLILFRGAVRSACGMAESATGPFYCPGDQQVYIDLAFFDQLKNRFKAPGDFAQAYVIAHEIGHHLQTLLGISSQVNKARQGLSKKDGNKLSVRQELQADCLAGVWANNANKTRQLLERGDIEEGLRAATAIGDDALQKQSRGYVTPDSFTHGSSEQRVKWFRIGLNSGDMDTCDTFNNFNARAPGKYQLPKIANARTNTQTSARTSSGTNTYNSNDEILSAFTNQRSDLQVKGTGIVSRTLRDDNEGSRHQKFILKLDSGQSLLVAHNIDLAPRVDGIKSGDRIDFHGEYEWSEQGGVLHWTHDDPGGRHKNGWLKHKGKTYH